MTRSAHRNRSPETPPRWRLLTVVAVVGLVACAVLARAVELQVIDRDFLREEAAERHLRTVSMPAHRGVITDRSGEILAISSPVQSAWAHPGKLLGHPQTIDQLARILERPAGELHRYLEQRREREFVYLRRHLAPRRAEQVQALHAPGVELQREFRRFYPAGEVTAQLIGITDIDGRGLEGVERAFNDTLRGRSGAKRVLRDRLGRTIKDVALLQEPRPGERLTLALDRRIQYHSYRALKRAVQRHGARAGTAVVLDAATGELLALVNQPSYNPNARSTPSDDESHRNRGAAATYEPGSVIKPFTVASALRSGSVAMGETIDTAPGTFRVAGHTVRDVRNYGRLKVTGVIRKSSNVGAAKIALRTPPRALWQTLQDFGFGAPTGSRLPTEASGYVDPAPPRRRVERATLAYGYGIAATPLQLARAYAAIANDGVLRPVSLLARQAPAEGYRVLDAEIAGRLQGMLEAVVSPGGTGHRAAVAGYRVAGKTGTVRKVGPDGYAERKYVALFAGFAPVSDPRFVIVVLIDEPTGEAYYGGQIAAPVFSQIMAEALRMRNVPPDQPEGSGVPVIAVGEEP